MTTSALPGKAIAVMSSKGGVGKTTISLGLAETIASESATSILLIDADPQGSITSMMDMEADTPVDERATLVSMLLAALDTSDACMLDHIVASLVGVGGSDIDGAERLDILPVGRGLIELERGLTRSGHESHLAQAVGRCLDVARKRYDLILVDCSPGLYLSTECWLRLCDFQLSPIKADKISLGALDLLFDFRRSNKDVQLAHWLGVVINSYQNNETERAVLESIRTFNDLRLFDTIVPSTLAFQRMTIKSGDSRSYHAKYPGASGEALRRLSAELAMRIRSTSHRSKQLLRSWLP
jgi:chromosome partitioning protein